jgi:hypothetical protein
MTNGLPSEALDAYIPEDVRTILEERFWQPVQDISTLEAVSGDETLASAPDRHPALFADHGIVHARDVTAGTLQLAGVANGQLLPARPADRQDFVAGLAVLLAYIHDSGMNDPTPEGRRIHALHAAHIPFSGEMDDVLARLWDSDGPVVRRVRSVNVDASFGVPEDVVLRELISLALGHSKSAVPADLHGDFPGLRRVLQHTVLVELDDHRVGVHTNGDLPRELGQNARWYEDAARDAFAWLDSPEPAHRMLADDAVDAVRLVRAADALRQRGSTLRTAAGYEIFIDAETGQSVFSLRTSRGENLFLLRVDSPLSAGEANIRKAEVTPHGNLRMSFHRGRFETPVATNAALAATARVVADIGADVLGAFEVRRTSPELPEPWCVPGSMLLELERPADEPAFAELVAEAVARDEPGLSGRVFVVADLENASPAERARYLEGIAIAADSDEAGEILDTLEAHGMRVGIIDRRAAFEDVRRVRVGAGEVLVEPGSPPAFVYIAFESSLRIEQLGGYQPIELQPWIPIGVTGVVRRAERNSKVTAAKPGEVLMIPGELFAREWFRPYEKSEIMSVLTRVADNAAMSGVGPASTDD